MGGWQESARYLSWLLVHKTHVDKCWNFTYVAATEVVSAGPLEHSSRSSVTFNLSKKINGENYFYFLLGTREKEAEIYIM